MTASEIKALLNLQPHPVEGGNFRRTYTSVDTIELPRGTRPLSTAIYYLLEPGTFSEMHVLAVRRDLPFLPRRPGGDAAPLRDGSSAVFTLGPDITAGQHVQLAVPARVWQGARLVDEGKAALLGCTVTPGFDLADYRNASCSELVKNWPAEAGRIRALTRR